MACSPPKDGQTNVKIMKPDPRAQTPDDSFIQSKSRQNSDLLIGVRSGYPWGKVLGAGYWLCLDQATGCEGQVTEL